MGNKLKDINTVTVVGAGFMGSGISVVYVVAGLSIQLVDVGQDQLEKALANMRANLETLAAHDLLGGQPIDALMARVHPTTDLPASVANADLVHEIVFEDLDLKISLFKQLDELCPRDTILASNTSGFRIRDLALATGRPDRVVGIHYISPPYILKPVEVIASDLTSPETVEAARRFVLKIDKVPVVCKDVPGFLVNRIQLALYNVCHSVVEQGLATPEDIDNAMRLSVGPRLALWGPLKTEDVVVNKATMLAGLKYLFKETGEDRYKPTALLERMVSEGKVGILGGQGWHDFSGRSSADVARVRDSAIIEILKFLAEVEPRTRV